ncbi:unnamed protein product [Symbiodinium natans]|uniref:SAM domain-containing protein n=1 Tax=Symbiodinium natans TaxID=878477 RepID=A0A812UBR1_9DINO|nr:unnamed protein product [Symbiodinium natans]
MTGQGIRRLKAVGYIRRALTHFPERLCRLARAHGGHGGWSLEALTPRWQVHLQRGESCETLDVGRPRGLRHGDIISFCTPPANWASYCLHLESESEAEKQGRLPNRYPARFPCRSSLPEAPEAPEELRRLAWQTDQMRRRSEQDQVRVADWSNFSQYVKQHYSSHGIYCTSWKLTRGKPCDPKPASFEARKLPSWICELLAQDRPVPGSRELPYASCLEASGHKCGKWPSPTFGPLGSSGTQGTESDNLGNLPNSHCGSDGGIGRSDGTDAHVAHTEVQEVNPLLLQPIQDWLESVDDSGFLLQYYDQIVANFDSLKQIHDVYFHDGCLDPQFFLAAGVTKLGHKRILQKWFRDHFG